MGLRNLIVRITGDKTGLDSTLKGAEGSLNSFGSVVKKIGGFIGVAFGAHAIKEFIVEASRAAAEAEGIANAFKKIGDSNFLKGLQEATRGQIGNTGLMKMAVQANNLNIPLKDLSMYLDFATKRAISTGKSINEMTEAIVMGVGRQSPRSFIQLGISVDDFNKKIKEANGDKRQGIKALVEEGLPKMGDVAETTAEKIGRLSTAWSDFKKNIGKEVDKEGGLMNQGRDYLTTILGIWNDPYYSFLDKASALLPNYGGLLSPKELAQKKNFEFTKQQQSGAQGMLGPDWMSSVGNFLKNNETSGPKSVVKSLADLNTELEDMKKNLLEMNAADVEGIAILKNKIDLQQQYIDMLSSGMMSSKILGGATKISGVGYTAPSRFSLPGLKGKGAKGSGDLKSMTTDWTGGIEDLQASLVDLSNTFSRMFANVNGGFQGMMEGVIKGLQRLAQELVAKAAILAIMGILFPEAGIIGGGMFTKFLFQGMPGIGGGGMNLSSTLSGKDIGISLRRNQR